MTGDDELEGRLADALHEPAEGPSAERVAAIRAAAEEAGAQRAASEPVAAPIGRRRLLVGGAAAAAVAAGAVVGGLVVEAVDEDPEDGPPTEALALSTTSGVTARGELINHTWGVELVLTGSGFAAAGAHTVTYRTTAGEDVTAGGFVGVGDEEMVCRCTGQVLRDDTSRIEVTDAEGMVVVSADLT